MTGWECPRCRTCYAPWIESCGCAPPASTTTDATGICSMQGDTCHAFNHCFCLKEKGQYRCCRCGCVKLERTWKPIPGRLATDEKGDG